MERDGGQRLGKRVVSRERSAAGGEGLDFLGQGFDLKRGVQGDVDQDMREATRLTQIAEAIRLRVGKAHPDETVTGTGKRHVKQTGVLFTLLIH